MSIEKLAIQAIYSGNLVDCKAGEWPQVRSALHAFASKCIDSGDGVRAGMALAEVKRLDSLFRAVPEAREE